MILPDISEVGKVGIVQVRNETSIARNGGHEQLIISVESARNHARKEDEPDHELLVSAVLANIGQNQVKVDHLPVVLGKMCAPPKTGYH